MDFVYDIFWLDFVNLDMNSQCNDLEYIYGCRTYLSIFDLSKKT